MAQDIASIGSHTSKSSIHALVPLSEMIGFSTGLRSMTQGDGSFSMAFAHYQPVGDVMQQKMIDRVVW